MQCVNKRKDPPDYNAKISHRLKFAVKEFQDNSVPLRIFIDRAVNLSNNYETTFQLLYFDCTISNKNRKMMIEMHCSSGTNVDISQIFVAKKLNITKGKP